MYTHTKIGILGGDMRQAALARRLSAHGFEVAVWGLPKGADVGGAVRCMDWKSTVAKSRVCILPLPVSKDGVRLYSAGKDTAELRLTDVANEVSVETLLLAGKPDSALKSLLAENNIPVIDYFDCEELQIKNAVPTAEGAVEIAMRELPFTLFDTEVLVLGYGRIGKVLSAMLHALHARVCVAARRREDIAYITIFGCDSVQFGSAEFEKKLKKSRVVFNTVPAKVLTKSVLETMQSCRLIVDLASGKGGTDFDAATAIGIPAVHALSLPGKVAPATAGDILFDCILEILKREGVCVHP